MLYAINLDTELGEGGGGGVAGKENCWTRDLQGIGLDTLTAATAKQVGARCVQRSSSRIQTRCRSAGEGESNDEKRRVGLHTTRGFGTER
jgi:hypothetical protein